MLLQNALERGWEGEVWIRPAGIGEAAGFPAWLTLRPLPHGEGAARRLAGLLHDLTPQRLHERELREAYEQAETARQELLALSAHWRSACARRPPISRGRWTQLEEQNRALRSLDRLKSEFVALTSHELRTPLPRIRAGLEFILTDRQPIPGPYRAHTLELVQRETQRLGRFVESILNLSALEAGRLPLQPAPTNLAQCVEGGADLAGRQPRRRRERRAAAPGGEPAGRPAGGLGRRPDALQRALPPPGQCRQIRASRPRSASPAEAQDGLVEILVSDQGPGMPAEQQTQLLQMFSRLESADAPRVPGYGLGLYMSRRFVEAMGGEIELQSAPGKGMTVRVRLPVVARRAYESSRVLVVDDDETLRAVLSQFLEREGYTVTWPPPGPEGLRAFYRERPHAVILDLMLPGMDGWEVCARLRELSDVPIICSARARLKRTSCAAFAWEWTITFPSPSAWPNWPRACRRCWRAVNACAESRARPGPGMICRGRGPAAGRRAEEVLALTPTEFRLLLSLIQRQGALVSEDELREEFWGRERSVDPSALPPLHLAAAAQGRGGPGPSPAGAGRAR